MKVRVGVLLLITTSPLFASEANKELDAAFHILASKYAQMKMITEKCDYPLDDPIRFKMQIIERLAGVPDIDLLAADRDMEKLYKEELKFTGPECADSNRKLYFQIIDRIDRDLDMLEEAISEL